MTQKPKTPQTKLSFGEELKQLMDEAPKHHQKSVEGDIRDTKLAIKQFVRAYHVHGERHSPPHALRWDWGVLYTRSEWQQFEKICTQAGVRITPHPELSRCIMFSVDA